MITISSSSSVQLSTIECLSLAGVQNDLHKLFAVTPMLHELDTELDALFHGDMICVPPMHLKRLSINTFRATMVEIRHLLSPMICLTDLTLKIRIVDTNMTDGNAWIPLLSRIAMFKFVFIVTFLEKVNLDSFRTRFWLEEKKWCITYDLWIDSYGSVLYTNPYCADHYYRNSFNKETLGTESTGLEPIAFPHVKDLWINSQSTMEKDLLNRYTHVRSLTVGRDPNISLEYIATSLDVSRLTRFDYMGLSETRIISNEFIRTLHTLPCLRSLSLLVSTLVQFFDRQWPQIIHLNMPHSYFHPSKPLSSLEIESFWRSFTKLEQLVFCREYIQDLARFFDYRTDTLSNVVIRHYYNINSCDPSLITRECLEENTQLSNFAYFRNIDRVVYIWL